MTKKLGEQKYYNSSSFPLKFRGGGGGGGGGGDKLVDMERNVGRNDG